MFTKTKKDFLKKISGGLHVLMATTYTADEIAAGPENEVEEYIAEHLLEYKKSAIGVERSWFSETKFDTFIDTKDDKTIADLLYHMDNIDFNLSRVFDEACVHPDDLTEDEKNYAEMIRDDKLRTFFDFIN